MIPFFNKYFIIFYMQLKLHKGNCFEQNKDILFLLAT